MVNPTLDEGTVVLETGNEELSIEKHMPYVVEVEPGTYNVNAIAKNATGQVLIIVVDFDEANPELERITPRKQQNSIFKLSCSKWS